MSVYACSVFHCAVISVADDRPFTEAPFVQPNRQRNYQPHKPLVLPFSIATIGYLILQGQLMATQDTFPDPHLNDEKLVFLTAVPRILVEGIPSELWASQCKKFKKFYAYSFYKFCSS